jgi:hypothetical protein
LFINPGLHSLVRDLKQSELHVIDQELHWDHQRPKIASSGGGGDNVVSKSASNENDDDVCTTTKGVILVDIKGAFDECKSAGGCSGDMACL